MALKKPSDYFNNQPSVGVDEDKIVESVDVSELSTFSDAFNSFKGNLEKIEALSEFSEALDTHNINTEKIEHLSEKINDIQLNLQNFLSKKDLDNAMMSQLIVVEKSVGDIRNRLDRIAVKNISEINEINETISNIENIVSNLVENEISFYDNSVKIISEQDKKITTTSNQIANVAKIVTKRLDEDKKDRTKFFEEVDSKILDIKSDIIITDEHLRNVDRYLQNHHSRVINLREEVLNEIKKLPIGDFDNNIRDLEKKINRIEELYSSINTDALVENVVKEGLLNEPPETKNSDPLTPLNQNFVTQQELQNHYKLFLNRIQQQLSTIGGGGETRLKYLDDIVGIATNPAAYDGKVLSYNHALRKFEFIVGGGGGNAAITISDTPPPNPQEGNLWYDSSIGRTFIYYVDIDGSQWVDASPSGGVPQNITNTWITTAVGIHTLSNVGIGTTNPTSKLTVYGGDIRVGINTSEGVILTSPNGSKFRLIVDNSGALSTILVP